MNINHKRWRYLCIALLITGAYVARADKHFQEVIRHPQAYDRHRVSLVGVAVGNGPLFQLYKSGPDTQRPAPASESIQLIWQKGWKKGSYDLHKVRVIGVVDATRHGLWGNPCTILIESIVVLSPDTVVFSNFPSAVIRNDRSSLVLVELSGGNPDVKFSIPAETSISTIVSNGGNISVFSSDGKLIVRDKIRGLQAGSQYYDKRTGNFFYRIVGNRIEPVLPDSAKNWKWLP
jgi:hypothetical protein